LQEKQLPGDTCYREELLPHLKEIGIKESNPTELIG